MKKFFKLMQILFISIFAIFLVRESFSEIIKKCQYLKGLENAKVSVVMPVYNTQAYLEETLESLENQTLKEIEIVCVNDGSSDNSLQILRNHAKLNSKIKIVDQKNQGVSVARNNGIKSAKGKYIMFVDSDDLLPPYACEKAFECAEKYKADVVMLGNICFTDGEKIDVNPFAYDESKLKLFTRSKSQNPYYALNVEMSSVWNKIWKRSWLIDNEIWFKKGILKGEDGIFNIIAFSNVNTLVHDDNIFYCYRQNRPNSILNTLDVKKTLESILSGTYELIKNRYRFNFENSDEWLVNNILDSTFMRITEDLVDSKDKAYFAKKTLNILEKELIEKYAVVLNEKQQEKINILKDIADF